jgi:hypothetical protein
MMAIADELRAEGVTKGLAEALLLLLSHKFGALSNQVTETVQSADLPQVQAWFTRALAAGALSDVLDTAYESGTQ